MAAPPQLPANFFDKPGRSPAAATTAAPAELPPDFFESGNKEKKKAPPMGFGERMLQTGVGMAKGLGHTALGLSKLGGVLAANWTANTPLGLLRTFLSGNV